MDCATACNERAGIGSGVVCRKRMPLVGHRMTPRAKEKEVHLNERRRIAVAQLSEPSLLLRIISELRTQFLKKDDAWSKVLVSCFAVRAGVLESVCTRFLRMILQSGTLK